MNKFKVGDKVKCIEGQSKALIHEKIYTVVSQEGELVRLAEVESRWYASRFIPAYRGTAEIKLTRSGHYRFTLKGKNGEVVATSHGETYTRKAKCLQTLKRLFGEFEIVDKTKKKKV